MAYMPKLTQMEVMGCCQFAAAGIWPFYCHLSAPAGEGDRAATELPLLQCFEEEYRANMTLAASLLLTVSFLPPSHVSPKGRFVVTVN